MAISTDREIKNASNIIDRALARMDKANRGETASNILAVVRNLNDHVASKIWNEIEPTQPMDINKVASKLIGRKPYQFIGIFDKFLRKSVSHFTPSEDGAERLMIKYYRYLLEIKKLIKTKYNIEIIHNIDNFLEDLDEQTKEYYEGVANQISLTRNRGSNDEGFDNYYITRIRPFFVNQNIYYEVTLEPAEEKPNKFNRITAFTKYDMLTNYAVALRFTEAKITAFGGVELPIKIIDDWSVSIRPCEIDNFARILRIASSVKRGHNEYKTMMKYLTQHQITLIDIIDMGEDEYYNIKSLVIDTTKEKKSKIFEILDNCRGISLANSLGKNVIRYLLNGMNNRIIKLQWPNDSDDALMGLYLSKKCFPFEKHPFAFNPKGHVPNLYDLFGSLDLEGCEADLLARYINNSTEQGGNIFLPIAELSRFGSAEEINKHVELYNEELWYGHRPRAELGIYCDHIYCNEHLINTCTTITLLKALASTGSVLVDLFSEDLINALKIPDGTSEVLDDPLKERILLKLFEQSRVQLIYGAAGTGKSTLINQISRLMSGKSRIFLAKTNPAVENLRRKVKHQEANDEFITIDRFIKNYRYSWSSYDLIVVDECSTVQNEEIVGILNKVGSGLIVLAGDTYQIEAIGFGNWFGLAKRFLPKHAWHELTTPFRSTDEHLKRLWTEIRKMTSHNTALEQLVRNNYSHVINNELFVRKADDEIILCLNYNGLYGLNNINRLLQLGNQGRGVELGIWLFKIGDPILFNDSERFKVLCNNLKGRIIEIEDSIHSVKFTLEVEIGLSEFDVEDQSGLELVESDGVKSKICFSVNRSKPYYSDEDNRSNLHIMPFQVAYAVSIHKSQGLEYDSVKIVIADDSEEMITHNIFYTAITRAKKHLSIFWSPEVCNRVLGRLKPKDFSKDYALLKSKSGL